MRLLLDTHTLLWWLTDDGRLSAAARRAIRTLGNDVYASAVSGWEIATKHRKGRLPEAEEAVHRLPALLSLAAAPLLTKDRAIREHYAKAAW